MNNLVHYIVETSIILGVFLLFFESFLKREKSFLYNRYYLLLAPILAMILPLLDIPFIPGLEKTESLGFMYELPTVVTGVTTFIEPTQQNLLPTWVWVIYLSGATIFTLKLIVQLVQLYDIIAHAKKKILAGDHILVIARDRVPTFAFMQYIVIGSDKSVDENTLVHSLNHERVHIRQGHSIDILIIEFLTIVFWFNPAMYYFKRTIRENHEFLADEQAARDEPLAYSLALLKEMRKGMQNAIPNYFSMQFTKKRLQMIGNKRSPFAYVKSVVSLPMILLLFVTFSCKNELLESNAEPVQKIDADFFSQAPADFEAILEQFKTAYPDKKFYFKIVKDIDLEVVKAADGGFTIDYYHEIDQTATFNYRDSKVTFENGTPGIGVIYSAENNQSLYASNQLFDEKVYTEYEVTHMPEPWLGEEHLMQLVASNTQLPDIAEGQSFSGTVWVRFVVNSYGNIVNSRPLNHSINTNDVHVAQQFYGRALEAVRALDGYYKPGELQGNKVNVELDLPVHF